MGVEVGNTGFSLVDYLVYDINFETEVMCYEER